MFTSVNGTALTVNIAFDPENDMEDEPSCCVNGTAASVYHIASCCAVQTQLYGHLVAAGLSQA